ncbi:DNA primase TraC [compost metagenome]
MSNKIDLQLADLPLLLRFIPADSREVWLKVGMGVKVEFGEPGFDAWDDWSQSGTGYSPRDAVMVWRSFRKAGTGMGTVIKLAKDAGWLPEKRELSREDKRRLDEQLEARRKAREAEVTADKARTARMNEAVAEACACIWAEHCRTEGASDYLQRKRVAGHGVRYFERLVVLEIDDQAERCQVWVGTDAQRWLGMVPKPRPAHLSMMVLRKGYMAVPLRDAAGRLWSLQSINGQGTKLFPRYGRKQGCFHLIGEPVGASVLAVAEGYATAASVHEATGWPVAMAFDAGNLLPVGRALRELHPEVALVFAGDDDPTQPGNPGRTKAEAAAAALDAVAAFPALPAGAMEQAA